MSQDARAETYPAYGPGTGPATGLGSGLKLQKIWIMPFTLVCRTATRPETMYDRMIICGDHAILELHEILL